MVRKYYDDPYPYYSPSQPIPAQGGVKSRTKRGRFGENWWARRWISVLENLGVGSRLERGRAYARQGQVLAVEVHVGIVVAKVQGSRRVPYDVTIRVKPLSDKQWMKVGKRLAAEASLVAKLMAGEMPEDVEDAFVAVGLSLFPSGRRDLSADCSCPDNENPCKHIAAVYYLMGEEFDHDPFLVFRLRGMDHDGLLTLIEGVAAGGKEPKASAHSAEPEAQAQPSQEQGSNDSQLPVDIYPFWTGHDPRAGAPACISFEELSIPKVTASWVKRLGQLPFWRGDEDLLRVMEEIYSLASLVGVHAFLGEIGADSDVDRARDGVSTVFPLRNG